MPSAAWQRLCAAVPAMFVTVVMSLVMALSVTMFTATPADALTVRERKVRHGVEVARDQIGDPYIYGSAGPNRFDCSGLTMFSYGRANLYLPRSSGDQYRYVRHIHKANIRRGDLMFFYDSGGIYHVGLFLGRSNGHAYILHASRPGTLVHRQQVWTHRWRAGTLRFR